ncbi:MAG: 3-oxoacyl-ACP reductase FabG [Eubacteriales bacterium]|nr:3-oxoacyl-ACP reductase FabG [Eubacteriales bacterium]
MRLEGKVAVVTGGARGIGQAIAELFAKEGAKVLAVDMGAPAYENEGVEHYSLNVTDVAACEKFVAYAKEKYGKIDVLVNNAGITRDSLTRKMTDDMWNLVLDVNLKGPFNLTRLIGPMMQEAGIGSIISMSSVVGEFGNIGQANYAATKAGLYGMSKTWAKEFAMKGAQVRSNTISPGYTMTDIVKTVPQDLLDKFAAQTMLGRLGEPEDIAKAALFLASDDSSYITGHNLSVNGGMRL